MRASTPAFIHPRPRVRLGAGRDAELAQCQSQMGAMTKAFAFAVTFVAGWYLCLPEQDFFQAPWWAVKHKLAGKVLVHEALFGIYLLAGGLRVIGRRALPAGYPTLSAAWGLVVLAVWCGVASLLAPYPLHDVGRSARLVFMALLLLAVTDWAARNPLLILRAFLFGLLGGSVVNLVLTFQNPIILAAGALPRLLGQNAPGPPMGIAVCLSAWLILVSRNRGDTVLGLIAAVVCGVGAMISYSKTGMLAAFLGLLSIAVVSGRVAPSRRGRIVLTSLLALILGGAMYFRGETGQRMWRGFSLMLSEKVATARPGFQSVSERSSYVQGVAEIVAKYPLGVGFSGFRGAMLETRIYRSGHAADETFVGADESNPHSLFLYYASAGGLVGGALSILVFGVLCRAMLRGLGLYGGSGALLAVFGMVAYFVLASSVPYLFNMGVMLIPAALAAGIYAHVTHGRPVLVRESRGQATLVPAT